MKKLAWFLLVSNFLLTIIVMMGAFATYDYAQETFKRVDYLTKLAYKE